MPPSIHHHALVVHRRTVASTRSRTNKNSAAGGTRMPESSVAGPRLRSGLRVTRYPFTERDTSLEPTDGQSLESNLASVLSNQATAISKYCNLRDHQLHFVNLRASKMKKGRHHKTNSFDRSSQNLGANAHGRLKS